MKLGMKIAAIRKELGETQEEFAKRFGKAQSTIGGWEADFKVPRHKDLLMIAQLGNTSVEKLMGVSEDDRIAVDDVEIEDPETKKVIADLIKRIMEAEGDEKKMLLNMLRGIINTK